jgi:hypothetical protein
VTTYFLMSVTTHHRPVQPALQDHGLSACDELLIDLGVRDHRAFYRRRGLSL